MLSTHAWCCLAFPTTADVELSASWLLSWTLGICVLNKFPRIWQLVWRFFKLPLWGEGSEP